MKRKIPWIGRLNMAKMSIILDPSKNPCRFCVLACLADIQKVTKLYMEMRQIRDGQAPLKKESKTGRDVASNSNACDKASY